MTPIRILAAPLTALILGSCASQKIEQPLASTPPNAINSPSTDTANPIYDTPAAYEASGTTAPAAEALIPSVASEPAMPTSAAPKGPKAPSNGAAIIHTVVAGDTISGISSKYKVPIAAIKKANGMTKDIVVLGKKMVIPPIQ